MHPLDNVIWQALTTRQRQFAEAAGTARRFPREVTSLSGFAESGAEGYQSLADLVGPQGTAAVFLESSYEERKEWEFVGGAPLLEMVSENGIAAKTPGRVHPAVVELGANDSPEMVELAALTKPGPFGNRTHELGTYLGIRIDGKLAAMAGERLKVHGYTEISAVCTHPEHTGKGYAKLLMMELMMRIRERGEIPFLHVRRENFRAIDLYERLGFSTRTIVHFAVLRFVPELAG
jgi:predicted GNAT family acetyltransferase